MNPDISVDLSLYGWYSWKNMISVLRTILFAPLYSSGLGSRGSRIPGGAPEASRFTPSSLASDIIVLWQPWNLFPGSGSQR